VKPRALLDIGPATAPASAPPGTFAVRLTVQDGRGGVGVLTQNITITQDSTPPVLTLSSPISGSTIQGLSFSLAGSSSEALSSLKVQISGEAELNVPLNADLASFQMQMTVGAAFSGYLPISVYPRLNFLMLAMGDMSNIVDKMAEIYSQKYPKVIIRSAVGPDSPIHPGHQHVGDFTEGFKKIFKNIEVVKLENPEDIFPAYQKALDPNNPKSYLMIEVGNYYGQK
jgi:hypothetical protein